MDSDIINDIVSETEEKQSAWQTVTNSCPECRNMVSVEVRIGQEPPHSKRFCHVNCETLWNRKNQTLKFMRKLGVPKRFENCSFDNFVTTSNIIKEIRDVIDSKDYSDPVLFTGQTTGTGKTHLAIATLVEIGKLLPITVKFTNFSILMGEIFKAIKSEHEDSVEDVIRAYAKIGVLCIDDLGAEHTTPYSTTILYRILNNRYENMVMTIVTTNLKGEEICEMYDRRILSRMICGHIFKLTGKDKRIGNVKNIEI